MSRTIQGPRRASRRSAPVIAAAALGLALAVSGCAAGQISQTAQQVAAIDGGNASVGQLSVLNVIFETPAAANYGPGSTVPVSLVISNHGTQGDTLTGVSSPDAAKVTISAGKIALPQQFNVQVNSAAEHTISLEGLSRPLCFGQSIPVTFTFAQAGTVTVRVPIANPVERRGTRDTINIQPPHPTPVWLTGAEGHGAEEAAGGESHAEATGSGAEGSMTTVAESSGVEGGSGEAESSMSGASATAAPATACNGF